MVTKLKARILKRINMSKFIKLMISILVGGLICIGVFYLFDDVFNGVFVDWFTDNYMTEKELADSYIVYQPDWYAVKRLLLCLCIVIVVVVICIINAAVYFNNGRKLRKVVNELGDMIHTYMLQEKEASDIFPNEYLPVSARIVEIKAAMRHNEQVLKDEAVRKNDMITYLAHDLKTPLTSIIGYLSLLNEATDMPKAQQEKYIRITLDKAYRLEKLINEFFEITRYNLQHIELDREWIDLYYMLVQMSDEFYPLLGAHGNNIVLRADEGLKLYADAEKLARVFNNILKNAIAYSYENTAIEISAEIAGNEVSIRFTNRGRTIPSKKIDALFEKFFRLDEARSTNTGGAGLGLAIAKDIVTLHGGSITVSSENKQTCFCVRMPQS